MQVDNETRLRLVKLLDQQFDNYSTMTKYFEKLNVKMYNAGYYDTKCDRQHINQIIEKTKACPDEIEQKYRVIQEDGQDVLILKKTGDRSLRRVMIYEDSYDILIQVHRKLGHVSNKQIYSKIRREWTYPTVFVNTLVESCNVCNLMKRIKFVNELKDEEREQTWRIRLLDLNEEFPYIDSPKYILICEDVSSEFLILRPLDDQNIDSITDKLLKVFYQFGAPMKLLAAPEFIYSYLAEAIQRIAQIDLQLVSDIQIGDEDFTTSIGDSDVTETLKSWIDEAETTNYEIDCELGCHVVQRKLNTRVRVTNAKSIAYKAFLPHNLFMKHAVSADFWDDDAIIKTVVHDNKRKLYKSSGNVPNKKSKVQLDSGDDSD